MCSRYEIDTNPRDLAQRFALDDPPPVPPAPEPRPTDRALVIAGARQAHLLVWGLPAPWNDKPLINARAETLARKKTFRPLLGNRCLVPATAYFEWRSEGRHKLKMRIAPADGGLMAFAGPPGSRHSTD